MSIIGNRRYSGFITSGLRCSIRAAWVREGASVFGVQALACLAVQLAERIPKPKVELQTRTNHLKLELELQSGVSRPSLNDSALAWSKTRASRCRAGPPISFRA